MNPITCDTAYFGRYRNHHVHVISHQMAFLNAALFLRRQCPKHLSEMLPQFPVQHLPSELRYEYDVVFALPFRMA